MRDLLERSLWTGCSIENCPNEAKVKGPVLCWAHYKRTQRGQDLTAPLESVLHRPGPSNPNWKGDDAGYFAVHKRMRVEQGSASEYLCVDCGNPADHWSYNAGTTGELGYSTDVNDYSPRCLSCHALLDDWGSHLVSVLA